MTASEQTLDQERRELWERVKARFNAWYHAHNFDMAESFGPGWTPKYAEQMAWVLMTAPPEGLECTVLHRMRRRVRQAWWRAEFAAKNRPAICRESHPDAACAVILAALAAAGEE